jgi:hypothetical protein
VRTIRIRCPYCQLTQSVPSGALLATVVADAGDGPLAGSLTWICGECDDIVCAALMFEPLLAVIDAGAAVIDDDVELDGPVTGTA